MDIVTLALLSFECSLFLHFLFSYTHSGGGGGGEFSDYFQFIVFGTLGYI
jgi:hypothetical protein